MRTEGSGKLQPSNCLNNTHSTISGGEEVRKSQGVQSSHTKPNMMYNLSLYRKNYRRKDMRNDKVCMKVLQNFARTSEDHTRETHTRKAEKLQTIA